MNVECHRGFTDMAWPIPASETRTQQELRSEYELEVSLADELRRSDKKNRQRLYGQVYDRLFTLIPSLAQKADPERRRQEVELQLQALAPFLSPETVFLEIGAGDCALALDLADRIRQVWAVDASAKPASLPRRSANFQHILSGEIRLPLDGSAVDVAYSCHFLEHLHPDDAIDHVSEVRRVLRPHGCYVCVTPNRLWGPHDISRYFDDEPTGLHLKEYSFRELVSLFRDAGFRRVSALRGIGRPPRIVSPAPYVVLEILLDSIPIRWRRQLLRRTLGFRKQPPFRPLEQVVLVAWP